MVITNIYRMKQDLFEYLNVKYELKFQGILNIPNNPRFDEQ